MSSTYQLALQTDGRSTRAVIAGIGAALRDLSVGGVDLSPGFDDAAPAPYYFGKILAPWPNRIRDGQWTLDGRPQQLDITDSEHRTALHGLLTPREYSVEARSDSAITLTAPIAPQRGYPFRLDTEVHYQLTADGLVTRHRIHNVGTEPAPVGLGAHPFLQIGDVPTEALTLTLQASQHIDVDAQMIPVGATAVDDTQWDLRGGRAIADLDLDDCWSVPPGPGGSSHILSAPDGRTVTLWADEQFGYVHVFITRVFPRDGGLRTAVAIEPMTAQADAFNNGAGLRWLRPGQTLSASWGIRYDDGAGS